LLKQSLLFLQQQLNISQTPTVKPIFNWAFKKIRVFEKIGFLMGHSGGWFV